MRGLVALTCEQVRACYAGTAANRAHAAYRVSSTQLLLLFPNACACGRSHRELGRQLARAGRGLAQLAARDDAGTKALLSRLDGATLVQVLRAVSPRWTNNVDRARAAFNPRAIRKSR